jgi:hypothetical protein
MAKKEKVLPTGVVITYDKKGNIKTLYSPFMEDTRFEDPTSDTLYSMSINNQLGTFFKKLR